MLITLLDFHATALIISLCVSCKSHDQKFTVYRVPQKNPVFGFNVNDAQVIQYDRLL